MWFSSPWFGSLFHSPGSGRSLTPLRRGGGRPRRRPTRDRHPVEALEDRCLLSFSPVASLPVGTNPQAVATGDFNGDGRLDLATANAGGDSVSVLLGDGGGGFGAAVHSAAGPGPRSLAVGDFNADGKLDLTTAGASGVDVLLGNGDGGFRTPATLSVHGSPASVAVGDFNGDGRLDLGVTSNVLYTGGGYYGSYSLYQGFANVLLGNGTGAFAAPLTTALPPATYYNTGAEGAAVGDFNGDGRGDFAAIDTTWYGNAVVLLLANPDGSLGTPASFFSADFPLALAAGDVDGDGKPDLTAVLPYADGVLVLPGDGLGAFRAARSYSAGDNPRAVASADFNGDGKTDLVTANSGDDTLSVLLGTGAGGFTTPVRVATGAGPAAVAAGDFNRDGRADVAAADALSHSVSVLLNDGAWPALDAPSIGVSDVTVTEGNTGTVSATFTVTLSAAYGMPVIVAYATADGTATAAGGDYRAAGGTLTFAAGETSKTVTLLVNGDRLGESDEYFRLKLSDPANAFIADAQGVAWIADDEPRITIESPGSYVAEGNTGTTAVTFTVRLSAASDAPVSVNFSTAEGDTQWWGGNGYYYYGQPPAATAGVDYQSRSGTLTFAAGETARAITVLVNGDRLAEQDEAFSVDLSGASGGVIDWGHAVGTIVDDEPRIGIGHATVTEGNAGTKVITFTVTLSAASGEEVRIGYATADGSATAGTDYQAKAGTLIFAPGQTAATVAVTVYGDRLVEGNESFHLVLSGPTPNAHLGESWGYGTIVDDEPRVSVDSVSRTEGNSGVTYYTFTVSLSAAYDQPVTVSYATQDGTAKAGGDYKATSGTLTFAAGQTTKTVTVAVYGDTQKEQDEYFYLRLTGTSGNAVVENGWGLGTILNDDGTKPGGRK